METFWASVLRELEGIPEDGPVTRAEVETWSWWSHRLVNVLEEAGWFYRGESVKYQGWSTLLVVKGAKDGTPYVVFITERTTTDCMRVFRKQFEENRVNWVPDKFG